jgi:ketosteroid isomerase-like protein
MGRENVDLVRRAYEVFDTDLDALLLLLDPKIDWVSPSDALEPGVRHGHDGVREAFAATAMAWDEPTHVPEDFYAPDEDKVLVTVNFRGHGRGSGMEANQTEFHLWTMREGAVVRFEWFYRREAAMKAAVLGGR